MCVIDVTSGKHTILQVVPYALIHMFYHTDSADAPYRADLPHLVLKNVSWDGRIRFAPSQAVPDQVSAVCGNPASQTEHCERGCCSVEK